MIIQEDPFFLPKQIGALVNEFDVVGVCVLSQKLPHDSFAHLLIRYVRVLCYVGLLKLGIWGAFKKYIQGQPVANVLRKSGVLLLPATNINDSSMVETIKSLRPDVLVSIAFPQKIRNAFLNVPTMAAINSHGGYLPDFPGVFTPFWNLLKGAKTAGYTVHYMNEKIDGGAIIDRTTFGISPSDTIYSLYEKIVEEGLPLLVKSLKKYKIKLVSLFQIHKTLRIIILFQPPTMLGNLKKKVFGLFNRSSIDGVGRFVGELLSMIYHDCPGGVFRTILALMITRGICR